ncbi:MAG: DUF58 domain-containing protein [Alphaproteobacteria bacterium]|nr:DUF58 domain-containing protein [Alphaproteobacteria bacterium]
MNRYHPSRRAVAAVALGIPLSLLAGLAAPGLWAAGLVWSLLAMALVVADIALGASAGTLSVALAAPDRTGVARPFPAEFQLRFARRQPRLLEAELEANERLVVAPTRLEIAPDGDTAARFTLTPQRRGEGRLERLWLRWTGPMGLAWIQRTEPLDRTVPIVPDMESVREDAVRLFRRDTQAGLHFQLDRGAGTEYHALRDFQQGHDPRLIDWKQSGRHGKLIVKEFRVEQNQHIVCALDTGRLMSEPLLGQARLDRALHAILLLSYVGLKLGDRVGLFAFDSRPRLTSGTVLGLRGFAVLQRLASRLDYSTEETNFTLGLTQLAGELEHRSTVVLFTDFSDTTSAELMLENVARLLARHTVLFVVFRDAELERMREDEPRTPADATRAVIADLMLKERSVVMERLRQMGVELVDVPVTAMNAGVISAYLARKQRMRLQP